MKQLLSILLICLVLGSCKKYEDGPTFSLNSKKARLANKWKVESYYVNGVEDTEAYRLNILRESLEIFKSGSWQYSEVSTWNWSPPYVHGNWNLIHKKEELELIPDSPIVPYRIYKILRLKSTELWLEHTVSSTIVEEFHYIPDLDSE